MEVCFCRKKKKNNYKRFIYELIKSQITNYTKGSKTIGEYMQGLITRCDQLAVLGKPFDHEDQVEIILAGLSDDYKPIVDQIEGNDNPPSLTGNSTSNVTQVLQLFAERFSIKDPIDISYFLGIEATRTAAGLHLMQRKNIVDLLAKNNMHEAKPVSTPLPSSPKLTMHSGSTLNDPS